MPSLPGAVHTRQVAQKVRRPAERLAPVQAVHAWPDNWQVSGADFMTNWFNCHIAASASLGKPMVLEEVQIALPWLCADL